MEKAVKDGGSRFSQLPDDIVVQIYNKIMDLKTLCICQLTSKRLGLIVFQADTISFNVPLLNPIDYENEKRLDDDLNLMVDFSRRSDGEAASAYALDDSDLYFPSAIKFIKRFTKLKSLCIQFPSYVKFEDFAGRVPLLYWKIKLCPRADSDVSESEEEGSDEEREDKEEKSTDYDMSDSCLMDVLGRLKKVLGCIVEFPLLEKVSVMGSSETGIVTTGGGGEIDELRNFLLSYGTSAGGGGEIDELRNFLLSYGTSAGDHLMLHNSEISGGGQSNLDP